MTAKSFFEYLRPSNSIWWEIDHNAKNETCPWVFRGHASSDWKLIPSAFREKQFNKLSPLINYFESLPVIDDDLIAWRDMDDNQKAYSHVSLAYSQAIFEFHSASHELGLLNPFSYNNKDFPKNLKNSLVGQVAPTRYLTFLYPKRHITAIAAM